MIFGQLLMKATVRNRCQQIRLVRKRVLMFDANQVGSCLMRVHLLLMLMMGRQWIVVLLLLVLLLLLLLLGVDMAHDCVILCCWEVASDQHILNVAGVPKIARLIQTTIAMMVAHQLLLLGCGGCHNCR